MAPHRPSCIRQQCAGYPSSTSVIEYLEFSKKSAMKMLWNICDWEVQIHVEKRLVSIKVHSLTSKSPILWCIVTLDFINIWFVKFATLYHSHENVFFKTIMFGNREVMQNYKIFVQEVCRNFVASTQVLIWWEPWFFWSVANGLLRKQ